MDYKIIDSFLDKEHYLTVSSFLKSKSCPYYFEDSDTYKDSKNKNGFFLFVTITIIDQIILYLTLILYLF